MFRPLTNLVRQRPVLAVFEINLRCNSRCGYCALPLNEGRYEMNREEIREVFNKLYHSGIRYVFVQGGEPTLRDDLLDVLSDLHATGFGLALITNGTRLHRNFIRELARIPVTVSVSLDSLERETYRRIRGADQLPLVMAGVERLHSYPHAKYLTCILSRENLHEVPAVVAYAREHGFVPVVGAYHWNIERYGRDSAGLRYENSDAISMFRHLADTDPAPRGYFHRYLKDNIRWLSGDGLEPCDAGRYSIAIDASANVAPCLALPHAGNLLEMPVQDILDAFNRNAIKQCSDNSSCNMMCSRVVGTALRHPLSTLFTPGPV